MWFFSNKKYLFYIVSHVLFVVYVYAFVSNQLVEETFENVSFIIDANNKSEILKKYNAQLFNNRDLCITFPNIA